MRPFAPPVIWVLSCLLTLAACGPVAMQVPMDADGNPVELPSPAEAARNFAEVVAAVEPVAERECARRAKGANCDFLIQVDRRIRVPANAFQSEDETGRPVLTLTIGLIALARNADELAFVIGHEAAHHIEGHLARQRINAQDAADRFAELARITGGDDRAVAQAQELGAAVGARSFSKEFELEADALGTIITYRAGYDPLIGSEFFTRIPDPKDAFLTTHPPNAARIDIVRATLARLDG